jgi:hypothetical protein
MPCVTILSNTLMFLYFKQLPQIYQHISVRIQVEDGDECNPLSLMTTFGATALADTYVSRTLISVKFGHSY